MDKHCFRYEFYSPTVFGEVEELLLLAIVSAECIHGESKVRMEASYTCNDDDLVFVVDACTTIGKLVNSLFVGYLLRIIGSDNFRVEDRGVTAFIKGAAES